MVSFDPFLKKFIKILVYIMVTFCLLQHTSLSPDGKLIIIVGDNLDGMLVDSQTGKVMRLSDF